MKTVRHKNASSVSPAREIAALRARLAEAEQTLGAIRNGEVDVVVVTKRKQLQLFTLEGADLAYRLLIESMNEGALTLAADKTILYANKCFARMVKCPLEQVAGSSFGRFLSPADRSALRPLMKKSARAGSKLQITLHAGDGTHLPVQISVREIAKDGSGQVTIGMVVTDMTQARQTEELLRALTNRVVQAQEAERGRVALELHDNITQLICAVVFRSQALAESLSESQGQAKSEALKLSVLLGKTAQEVERISRDLRPGILDQLGLEAVMRVTSKEFTQRTGIAVKLSCAECSERLPADAELALYRIFQEALKNVEQHARGHKVTVKLARATSHAQLTIKDDGISFDPSHHPARQKGGLGLLSMRERANYVGGTLTVKSILGAGTEIQVRIPCPVLPSSGSAEDRNRGVVKIS